MRFVVIVDAPEMENVDEYEAEARVEEGVRFALSKMDPPIEVGRVVALDSRRDRTIWPSDA